MIGEVEPLKALQDPISSPIVIERVLRDTRRPCLNGKTNSACFAKSSARILCASSLGKGERPSLAVV